MDVFFIIAPKKFKNETMSFVPINSYQRDIFCARHQCSRSHVHSYQKLQPGRPAELRL